jgi:hypothetical protein
MSVLENCALVKGNCLLISENCGPESGNSLRVNGNCARVSEILRVREELFTLMVFVRSPQKIVRAVQKIAHIPGYCASVKENCSDVPGNHDTVPEYCSCVRGNFETVPENCASVPGNLRESQKIVLLAFVRSFLQIV